MDRIHFANWLRGFACLAVVVSHYCGYWQSSGGGANWTQLIGLEGYVPSERTSRLLFIFPTLFHDTPQFGVLLFFLISGFVIPFSLTKVGTRDFLVHRFFRLFPTYWVALAVLLATIVAARTWIFHMDPIPGWTSPQLWHNLLLTCDFAWQPAIEVGIWTLLIEIKFYLLAALVFSLRDQWRLPAVFLLAALGAAFCAGSVNGFEQLFARSPQLFITVAMTNAIPYLAYMLIGVVAHLFWMNWLKLSEALALSLLAFGVWIWLFAWSQYGVEQFGGRFLPSVYAVLVFWGGLLAERSAVVRKLMERVASGPRMADGLNYLAAISYPLYLLHGTFGYAVFCIGWHYTHSVAATLVGGLAIVLAVVNAVHFGIELPSIACGKWLTTRRKCETPTSVPVELTFQPDVAIGTFARS